MRNTGQSDPIHSVHIVKKKIHVSLVVVSNRVTKLTRESSFAFIRGMYVCCMLFGAVTFLNHIEEYKVLLK